MIDERRFAPAVARNAAEIAVFLKTWLPPSGTILEVASGTGEHLIMFADLFAHLDWQPSDPNPEALRSIAAWRDAKGSANLAPPIALDVRDGEWPFDRAAAILAINMIHISPWSAALGLLDGAERLLDSEAPLILYGPWIEEGIVTARSNIAFDADLRSRNHEWGLRRLDAFVTAASERKLDFIERRAMPANNVMLLFRRR